MRADGARPEPLSAVTRPVDASKCSAKQSPPMPVEHGSVTLSTAAMATAASAAVPPSSSTRRPARLARGWLEAVMPPRAAT